MSLLFNMLSRLVYLSSFSSKEPVSFSFMTAVAICSDFGAQGNKVCHHFHCFLIYLPEAYFILKIALKTLCDNRKWAEGLNRNFSEDNTQGACEETLHIAVVFLLSHPVTQLCPALHPHLAQDCSPPGSCPWTVQARMLEPEAISSSRGSSQPSD